MTEALRPTGELATLIVSVVALSSCCSSRTVHGLLSRGDADVRERREPLLEVEKPDQALRRPRRGQGYDFEVRGGEIVGLIGPNGSGKSTVMKCVMGIERADAGSVRIDGARLRASRPTGSRAGASAWCSSTPAHCTGRPCYENIKLALLPDSLIRLVRPRPSIARPAPSPSASGSAPCSTAGRPTLPFADLRRLELAKAIARHPQRGAGRRAVRGPHARRRSAAFSDLIRSSATRAARCCWSTTT